jgi:uncharacterized membrane protein
MNNKKNVKIVYYVLAALAGALFLYASARYYSIWFDESFSYGMIQHDFAEIIRRTAYDVHPPLYYVLLKGWTLLFGDVQTAIRMFSVFTWAVGLCGLWVFLRRFVTGAYHYIAWLLLGFAPQLMHYAIEARMYSLAMALIIWSTELFFRAFIDKNRTLRTKLLYALSIVLLAYTQYFTVFAVLIHFIVLCAHEGVRLSRPIRSAKQIWQHHKTALIAIVGAGLLYVPWLFVIVWQVTTLNNNGYWISTPDASAAFESLNYVVLGTQNVTGWAAASSYAVAGLLGYGAYTLYKKQQKELFVLCMAGATVPFVSLFLVSMPPFTAVLYPRYIAMYSVFISLILVLFAFGRSKRLRVALLVALGALNIVGYTNTRSDFLHNGWFAQKRITEHLTSGYLKEDELVIAANVFIFADLQSGMNSSLNSRLYFKEKFDFIGQYSAFDTEDFIIGQTELEQELSGKDSVVLVSGDNEDIMKYFSENTDWENDGSYFMSHGRIVTRYERQD